MARRGGFCGFDRRRRLDSGTCHLGPGLSDRPDQRQALSGLSGIGLRLIRLGGEGTGIFPGFNGYLLGIPRLCLQRAGSLFRLVHISPRLLQLQAGLDR